MVLQSQQFMQYTQTQLKQTLTKMLPETIAMRDSYLDARSLCRITTPDKSQLCWISNGSNVACPVLDTELLHLCWLVEETLDADNWNDYCGYLAQQVHPMYETEHLVHASWQQRTINLAKVKGIEII